MTADADEQGQPLACELLTGTTAGALLSLGAGAAAIAWLNDRAWTAVHALAPFGPLAALGALAGLVWSMADALAARGRLKTGVLGLALGGALTPLGAHFTRHLLEHGDALRAVAAILHELDAEPLPVDCAVSLAAAVALGAPLVVARARGARLRWQSLAVAGGAYAWLAGFVVWPWHPGDLESGFDLATWVVDSALPQRTRRRSPDVVDELELLALFAAVYAVVFPWLLAVIRPRVRRLLERVGVHESESPAASRPWIAVRRRAYVAFALLLAFELLVFPMIWGTRWTIRACRRSALRARAERRDLVALKELARAKLHEGDRTGVNDLELAADAGDAEAMVELAYILADGAYGVHPDPDAAIHWFLKSGKTEQANAFAFQHGHDSVRARVHLVALRRSCELAIAKQRANGLPLRGGDVGELVRVNDALGERATADDWLRRAAASDDALALFLLASRLVRPGRSDDERREGARCYERLVAVHRDDQAAYFRGQLEQNGALGPPDDVAALAWYRLALALTSRRDYRTFYEDAIERVLERRRDLK